MDPTRSMGRRDSLLKLKENVKRKCGLIFEFWKICPKGGTVLLCPKNRHKQIKPPKLPFQQTEPNEPAGLVFPTGPDG